MSASLAQLIETDSSDSSFDQRDGCLLLWFEGNVLFSLNESALVVWSEMEKYPEGVSVEELVDGLVLYYSECEVPKARIQEASVPLIRILLERGFLLESRGEGLPPKYRVKDDVFRTAMDQSFDVGREFDDTLVYRPSGRAEEGRWRAIADACVGFIAIIGYEVVIRLRGFGRLCIMVESWPIAKGRSWLPARVRQVCASVDRARLWYPKKVSCLQHSAVMTCLLKRQGVPAIMVFAGIRKPFYSHAWCEVEGTVVNDEQSVKRLYSVFTRCSGGLK